jgi:hypothetical protein
LRAVLLDPAARPLDELEPVLAYEGDALEQHLAALGAEQDRLRALIAEAEARRDDLLGAQPPSVTERLGAVMLDAQAQLTEEWEICRGTEAAIEDATEAAVARVLADARAHAASLRAIADELRASQAKGDDTDEWWEDVHDVIDLTRRVETEQAQSA